MVGQVVGCTVEFLAVHMVVPEVGCTVGGQGRYS